MADQQIEYRVLNSFSDPTISPDLWNSLVTAGSSDVIFITWHWQKTWWDVFGRGDLLLIIAEKQGKAIAIAPLFSEYGMVYFVGSGGSDYLDFIGNIQDVSVIQGMLMVAEESVADFSGFQFFHVPQASATNEMLQLIAERKGWQIYNEGGWTCPRLEMTKFPEQAIAATKKKSLLRHENYFIKNGELNIEHLKRSEEILLHLDDFFEQHISRWASTPYPSLFLNQTERLFFKKLAELADDTAWFRFTRVTWNGESVAYHFGFHYHGNFFWYKPTFSMELAKHSPGEVLLRQLLIRAQEEKAEVFDFGLGDEAFKDRFATAKPMVVNWGVYRVASNNELKHEEHFSYQPAS